MWLLGQIPIKRRDVASGSQARTAGKRILENNGLLFIYPEGRCSKTGELLPFKPGVADLAFETNTPVIPAGIVGSNGVKPLKSWKFRPRHPVMLQFGHALNPRDFTGSDAKESFLAELGQRIAELSNSNRK